MAADEGVYLYCFARSDALSEFVSPGVDGRPGVRPIRYRGIAAVCSQAPLDEFRTDAPRDSEPDAEWLIPRACRHEAVVEEAMESSPVLPVRFGALFSSPQVVEALLARQAPQIERFLAYAAGKQEWAVKGFLQTKIAIDWVLDSQPMAAAALTHDLSVSPGKSYFQQKQRRTVAEREVAQWGRTVAAEILESLKEFAVESRSLKLQSAKLAGSADEMTLNLAFLVATGRVNEFRSRLEALGANYRERGLTLACTGPWPPFSFCPSLQEAVV